MMDGVKMGFNTALYNVVVVVDDMMVEVLFSFILLNLHISSS